MIPPRNDAGVNPEIKERGLVVGNGIVVMFTTTLPRQHTEINNNNNKEMNKISCYLSMKKLNNTYQLKKSLDNTKDTTTMTLFLLAKQI